MGKPDGQFSVIPVPGVYASEQITQPDLYQHQVTSDNLTEVAVQPQPSEVKDGERNYGDETGEGA